MTQSNDPGKSEEHANENDEGLLQGRRRSFLRAAGSTVGVSILGGAATGSAGAAHDNSPFQVDFVNSTPSNLKDPLDETGNFYSDDGTLIRWIWGDDAGSTAEGNMTTYDGGTFSGATVTTQNGVELDQNNETATVEFTVSGGPVDLSLVSYDAPSGTSLGFDASEASDQDIYDLDYDTFNGDGALTVALPTKANAVSNHGFESGDTGNNNPDSWSNSNSKGSATFSYVNTESRTGSRSVKIDSTDGVDGQWFQNGITVDASRSYEVSGWLKTNSVQPEGGTGAMIEFGGDSFNQTTAFTGTNPWTYVQKEFRAVNPVEVRAKLGFFGQVSGTAFYDDIGIREIPARESTFGLEAKYTLDGSTATNSVTNTDASVTGSPTTGEVGIDDSAFGFTENADTSSAADGLASGNALPLNGQTATVTGWFNHTGTEGGGRVLQVGAGPDGTPTNGYDVEFTGGTNIQPVAWNGDTKNAGASIGINTNTWYFVALSVDGDDHRFHVISEDGNVGNSPLDATLTRGVTGNETLSMMAGGGGRDVAGRLDQVRAYSRALTDSEVWQLYESTQSDLKAYYSLDGSTATNAVTGVDATETESPTTGVTGIKDKAFSFTTENGGGLESGEKLRMNSSELTAAGWLYYRGSDGPGRFLQLGGGTGGFSNPTDGFSVNIGSGDDIYPVAWNGGSTDTGTQGTIVLSTNTWYFIALTANGDDFTLYVYDQNGELSASPLNDTLDRGLSGTETLNMMAGDVADVDGRLDEVYGYSRELSASEIDTLYTDSQT